MKVIVGAGWYLRENGEIVFIRKVVDCSSGLFVPYGCVWFGGAVDYVGEIPLNDWRGQYFYNEAGKLFTENESCPMSIIKLICLENMIRPEADEL